ncbi:MAG: hypothetical protein HOH04_01215 [Rhodospirillaceae bacterium]|nr:hypothetical protein [Rhodospirillaceae bacterium]
MTALKQSFDHIQDRPQPMTKRWFLSSIALAALMLQTGCETAQSTFDNVANVWAKPIVYACPDYRVLRDAARLVTFRAGPGRDLIDVDAEARIGDANLECLTYVDKETFKGHMEARFQVIFGARRGPANKTRRTVLPYFVSVTDKNRNVLYREAFKIAVDFRGNQTTVQFPGELIKLELPLSSEISSADYIIYTGFALDRAQLEYNQDNP